MITTTLACVRGGGRGPGQMMREALGLAPKRERKAHGQMDERELAEMLKRGAGDDEEPDARAEDRMRGIGNSRCAQPLALGAVGVSRPPTGAAACDGCDCEHEDCGQQRRTLDVWFSFCVTEGSPPSATLSKSVAPLIRRHRAAPFDEEAPRLNLNSSSPSCEATRARADGTGGVALATRRRLGVNYEGGEAVRETLPGMDSFPPPPPLPGGRAPGGGGGGRGNGGGSDSDSSRDRKRKRKDEKKEKKEKKKIVRPLSESLPPVCRSRATEVRLAVSRELTTAGVVRRAFVAEKAGEEA